MRDTAQHSTGILRSVLPFRNRTFSSWRPLRASVSVGNVRQPASSRGAKSQVWTAVSFAASIRPKYRMADASEGGTIMDAAMRPKRSASVFFSRNADRKTRRAAAMSHSNFDSDVGCNVEHPVNQSSVNQSLLTLQTLGTLTAIVAVVTEVWGVKS